jgi:NAD(P)-dependent dehydrogenase (short-subunit alcohol dehydrogenase family)
LVKADVARIEQVQAMVLAQEGLSTIDVLIVPFLEMTEHDWDHVLDVDLKGSCFCAQSVAKAMVSAKRMGSIINADGINHQRGWDQSSTRMGSIINIASGAALRGSPRGVHYVSSKGGVLLLTRAMALGLAPYRIRVKAIAPGLTDTAQPRYGSSEAEIVETARSILLGRMGATG